MCDVRCVSVVGGVEGFRAQRKEWVNAICSASHAGKAKTTMRSPYFIAQVERRLSLSLSLCSALASTDTLMWLMYRIRICICIRTKMAVAALALSLGKFCVVIAARIARVQLVAYTYYTILDMYTNKPYEVCRGNMCVYLEYYMQWNALISDCSDGGFCVFVCGDMSS